MDAAATIAADGWNVLMPELEQVPVFVCANAAGQPLQYERDGRPLALFYADITQAEQELADRRRSYPDLELRLLPIGLGSAFTRAGAGAGVIVPSPEELTNAADPEDADAPYEAGLPLFACLALRKPHASREGVQAVPLFMRAADAEASRDAAAAAMPPDTQGRVWSSHRAADILVICSLFIGFFFRGSQFLTRITLGFLLKYSLVCVYS